MESLWDVLGKTCQNKGFKLCQQDKQFCPRRKKHLDVCVVGLTALQKGCIQIEKLL